MFNNNWDSKYHHLSLDQKVTEFNLLIENFREPGFSLVLPSRVVPDSTNRENTGISVLHMHYIAVSI